MAENNPFTLTGKTVLVTGASSGIGRAVAIECSKLGGQVIVTGRNTDRLNETFGRLSGKGHSLIVADLTLEEAQRNIETAVPELDGIVHAAGITNHVPFQFVKKEMFDEAFAVNFFAPAVLTQTLVRAKKLMKSSSIVFISSISGVFGSAVAQSIYSSTKGALSGLIKGMALDLADKLIRVNAVCPGMIETGFFKDGSISEEQISDDKKRYPLKRYGNPEEVAYAAIYLLSDASRWVTGTNLLIDGGYTLL